MYVAFTHARVKGDVRARKRMHLSVASAFALVIGATLHSHIRLNEQRHDPTITVGIAQPNVDPYEKWSAGETPMDKVRHLLALYDSIAAQARPDLIVMPETAFPFYLRQASHKPEWDAIRARVDAAGIPLLTGFADLTWYDHDAPPGAKTITGTEYHYATFNSSMLLEPGNPRAQIYHKSRLTPLSERIPYVDVLPFLSKMLSWGVGISSWDLANDTTVFTTKAGRRPYRTWAMICYETLYPEFVAGFVQRGANALGVITNDGWFGNSSGPYQLQQYASLRAIETRRAIYRCANNGISCFIDPYGRVSQQTAFGTRTWIAGPVTLRSDQTLFVRYGDWFARGCCLLALLTLFTGEAQSFKRRTSRDRSAK
jgi:apolipoprotein N-acyltransferase